MTQTLEERLWSKVLRTDECWTWQNPMGTQARYPMIRVGGRTGKMTPAHRLTYEWSRGPIPVGLELDHLCRNRRCVRPDHLEPVTHRENVRRGNGWAGINARKSVCERHGFPLVPGPWARSCRTCRQEDNTAYRRRKGGHDRDEASRLMWARRSPDERAELSRKIWSSRRRNEAAREA